jgi:hypothetical protein
MILDYREVVLHSIKRRTPDYKLFRGVMPSWDNTARRKKGAHIVAHSSPELYEQWLAECIRWTRVQHQGEEQMVFINAWNEWGEGCHLEPDLRYGRQFLAATRNALRHADNAATSLARLAASNSHAGTTQAAEDVLPPMAQLLAENLYLKLRLRDQNLNAGGLASGMTGALVPRPRTFDDFLAAYLLADSPPFRRLRKGCYSLLKPLWRMWLAVRASAVFQTLRARTTNGHNRDV